MAAGMRKRAGYKAVVVDLGGTLGPTEVMVPTKAPHLGVIKAPPPSEGGDPLAGWYWVYHLPTRSIAGVVEGEDNYLGFVEMFGAVAGLDVADPAPEALAEAVVVMGQWRNARKVKKRAVVEAVRLEPVYNPGVTPSRAVRATDAELAALIGAAMGGDASVGADELWATARRAADLAWKEALVAAVNQVLANGDELPERPAYLVDGTPCNWEGWKEEYKQLIQIGNDLQLAAVALLDLTDMLGPDCEITPSAEWKRQYRDQEQVFVATIQRGWKHWGRAVSHFLASPPARQQQVIDKLVYIGNAERGWGALGRITFLRHPEVAEASRARRMVQYARDERRGAKV